MTWKPETVAHRKAHRRIANNEPMMFKIIAALQDETKSYEKIGQEHSVTRQRIQQLAAKAVSVGIKLPNRKLGRKAKIVHFPLDNPEVCGILR